LHCPLFPLISSITQQEQQQHHKQLIGSQNPSSKKLPSIPLSSFSKSFISSGKQGGGATVFREGCDIVTRKTYLWM
jgi:hypothetical protein